MLFVLFQANTSVCFKSRETAQTKWLSYFSSFNLKCIKRIQSETVFPQFQHDCLCTDVPEPCMLRRSSWKSWICTALWLIPCHVAHTIGPLIKAPTQRLNYSKATGMWRRPGDACRSADDECDLTVMAAIMLPDDLNINICFPEWRTHSLLSHGDTEKVLSMS